MSITTDAQKDPNQLEREVDERRAHLGDTLNALEKKLSPGHLFDQVLDYTRRNGGEFSQNLVQTVKQNPVPTLLTAIGVTWLMFGQSTSSINRETQGYSTARNSSTNLRETGHQLKDSISQSMTEAGQKVGHTADSLRNQAQRASASLREQGHKAKVGFSQLLEEQPLALGAIGIAIGALLGGSLPATRQEDELMGETRDRLANNATSTVKEAYQKTGDIGRKVVQETRKEVGVTAGSSAYGPQ